MPATSVRDLVIKDDDLVLGTHGRGFWILDDISPLRQLTSKTLEAKAVLFKPQQAIRVRWNMNTDTPLPQEEPGGENPPDGAIINYHLSQSASEVSLEIVDAAGKSIRKYSSKDKPYAIPDVNIPLYWIRPQQMLSAAAGAHRFLWDMHYTPIEDPAEFPMTAIYENTPKVANSPWVLPGVYTVKLTVDGKTETQTLTVKLDPRVKASTADLQQQHALSLACYEGRLASRKLAENIAVARASIKSKTTAANKDSLNAIDQELAIMEGSGRASRRGGVAQAVPTTTSVESGFAGLFGVFHETEMTPTTQTAAAVKQVQEKLTKLVTKLEAHKIKIKVF
jgi:hypothetical protein